MLPKLFDHRILLLKTLLLLVGPNQLMLKNWDCMIGMLASALEPEAGWVHQEADCWLSSEFLLLFLLTCLLCLWLKWRTRHLSHSFQGHGTFQRLLPGKCSVCNSISGAAFGEICVIFTRAKGNLAKLGWHISTSDFQNEIQFKQRRKGPTCPTVLKLSQE